MQLGVLLDIAGAGQKSIATALSLNKLNTLDEYWDAIVFYLEFGRMLVEPKFALMNMSELYGFTGIGIATDLKTADILIKGFGPSKKFFYMWDLEWTQSPQDINKLAEVYMNPEINLIARSDAHAAEIERCWRKPYAVLENFQHEELTKIIRK